MPTLAGGSVTAFAGRALELDRAVLYTERHIVQVVPLAREVARALRALISVGSPVAFDVYRDAVMPACIETLSSSPLMGRARPTVGRRAYELHHFPRYLARGVARRPTGGTVAVGAAKGQVWPPATRQG